MAIKLPNEITQETLDLVSEAIQTRVLRPDETRAITDASGYVGYDLEIPAKTINPVITPLVNMIPRRPGPGVDVTHWKAITSFDTGRAWGDLNGSAVPQSVTPLLASMQNTYQTIALSNSVDFKAQWRGRSLQGDLRSTMMAILLYQLKITEERWIINASTKLMVPPSPIASITSATGGGSSDSTTYWVAVTANNANGETTMSTQISITTAANGGANTNTLNFKIFTVANATFYNVYLGTGATAPARTAMYKQTAISGVGNAPQPGTNIAVALSGGGSVPAGEVEAPVVSLTLTAAPVLSGTNPPATNGATTTQDSNTNATTWDGLIAQALLNTSTANGLTLGAQVTQPAASSGLLALSDIDNLLLSAYNQAAADPDFLIMNPIVHRKITNLMAQSNQVRYNVSATQGKEQGEMVAQYRVTHYMNEATGKMIPIIPNRYCPAHTVVALPMSIPYPVPEVSNAVEIETNQEYIGVDFAVTSSTFPFADYVESTLKVYFLGGLCVLRGILPSS
jgi:PKD repeat protein